jgi:regulator of replication initiation timing
MLVTTPDMTDRLSSLEMGVVQLDKRITSLDSKVVEIILQNEKFAENQENGFRELHYQNENMIKTIKKMKNQYTSKCQIYTFGFGLAIWTFFVAFMVWR